jgi:hypothetical protein
VRKPKADGVKQLRKLIDRKAAVSYGNKRISEDEALALSLTAEGFETWAITSLENGIGRFGIVPFADRLLDPSSVFDVELVRLTVRPECFRVAPKKASVIEKFLSKTTPGMSVRT